jgi:hypothetical protein
MVAEPELFQPGDGAPGHDCDVDVCEVRHSVDGLAHAREQHSIVGVIDERRKDAIDVEPDE